MEHFISNAVDTLGRVETRTWTTPPQTGLQLRSIWDGLHLDWLSLVELFYASTQYCVKIGKWKWR